MIGAFYLFRYSLGISRKHQPFYGTANSQKAMWSLNARIGMWTRPLFTAGKGGPDLDFHLFGGFLKWVLNWLFIVYGCFISTSAMKNRAFFQFSPRRDLRLRHFSGYLFVISRKKVSTIFITQPLNFIGAVIVCGCFISTAGENTVFFPSFPLGGIHG